ncbi:fumarylacetoacetate hydrolase family protein [Pusillimonas sp.]|uniref:fumarylacetoacetate hydrolase family protein n=1 Tax=Pusillimonas sp. TaxID=3040095 RepID=UPI0029B3A35C|nr:fumarylacetoacetate hydrolase family protein [Pusillimonas sp.]MDX3895578.1 fumarylacetoacetate hydrolase family protein [Pusillimonas sp.]
MVEDDYVLDVSQALDVLPSIRYPAPPQDQLVAHLDDICDAAAKLRDRAQPFAIESVRFLSPVANPPKIIGAPINYQAHIEESVKDQGIAHGRTVSTIHDWGLFLKSSTSLIGFGEEIRLRRAERRNDHECELAVIIGKYCNRVAREDAMNYVAAYAIGLDMTVRGPEFQCWRKSVDTYSVLGPWLTTADEIDDPGQLDLRLDVNGEVRQSSNTRQMVLDVPGLIEMASSMYALVPGDIIMTGTPAGVGPVSPGDMLAASIQHLGQATIRVGKEYV